MLTSQKEKLEKDGQIYLLCKIFPGAASNKLKSFVKNNIEGRDVEILSVAISAPAEKNKANKELLKFLSKEFATISDKVSIISGSSDRLKLIKILK
ncbi:MAG TPA: DUF167 domain-containing protein [bacterium]|nr:DUF167 domain-containing protein [bacterium]